MRESILIIDADRSLGAFLVAALTERGYLARFACCLDEAEMRLLDGPHSALLLDPLACEGPSAPRPDLLDRCLSAPEALGDPETDRPEAPEVIVMAKRDGRTAPEYVLEALQRGAYDSLLKPFSLAELDICLRRALERRALRAEVRRLAALKAPRVDGAIPGLHGQSEAVRRLRAEIASLAERGASVLIFGESGAGKESAADAIRSGGSGPDDSPYLKLDCEAIPEPLLTLELLGRQLDAHGGVEPDGVGRRSVLAEAHRGALLIKEIARLPDLAQGELARAMRSGKLTDAHGLARPCDARVLATTTVAGGSTPNVCTGRISGELLACFGPACLRVPPLRERREDLPLLADRCLADVSRRLGAPGLRLSGQAHRLLTSYDWPGNLRELAGALERAAVVARGPEIEAGDLQFAISPYGPSGAHGSQGAPGIEIHDRETAPARRSRPDPAQLRREVERQFQSGREGLRGTLESLERRMLEDALTAAGGVQKDAAALLGLTAKNFWNKLRKHDIPADAFRHSRNGD